MIRLAPSSIRHAIYCLLIVAGFAGSRVFAQTPPDVTAKPLGRPRIGLALAGGGALGLAHIGVLEWFEENRIPVDVIAGTSMGGLVAGTYATGMSPAEMRGLLTNFPWETVTSGEVPYSLLSFRRKEDARNIQNRLVFGLRNGVSLPAGLNPGNTVNLLLARISLPYSDIGSFDDLPIPLRVVALDIGKGEPLILKDGDLGMSMRSTMSIPGLFVPVPIKGTLLGDALTVQNLPTEALKTMNPDVVIAVDLTTALLPADAIKSYTQVLGQYFAVAILDNVRRSLKLADVVVEPDVNGYGNFDFDKGDILIPRGYAAAEKQRSTLIKYQLTEAQWTEYKSARDARRRPDASTFTPQFIEIQGARSREILAQIAQKPGKPIDPVQLERDLLRLQGTANVESLYYDRLKRADGTEGLRVYATAKEYGPPFGNFGLEAIRYDQDTTRFSLVGRVTNYNVASTSDELRMDLRFGSKTTVGAEYYQRLKGNGLFWSPRLYYQEDQTSAYDGDDRITRYDFASLNFGIDVGLNPDSFREYRAGIVFSQGTASVATGPAEPAQRGLTTALRARYVFDGQDSNTVPTRGIRWENEAQFVLDAPAVDSSFLALRSNATIFRPAGHRVTVYGALGFGTTFGEDLPASREFRLGGPFRLSGYELDQLRGEAYAYSSLGALYKLLTLPSPIGGAVQVGSWYELGGTGRRLNDISAKQSISVGLVADTLIGPVLFGNGFSFDGRSNFFFGIGRVF